MRIKTERRSTSQMKSLLSDFLEHRVIEMFLIVLVNGYGAIGLLESINDRSRWLWLTNLGQSVNFLEEVQYLVRSHNVNPKWSPEPSPFLLFFGLSQ